MLLKTFFPQSLSFCINLMKIQNESFHHHHHHQIESNQRTIKMFIVKTAVGQNLYVVG